jgi:hypothetical protein
MDVPVPLSTNVVMLIYIKNNNNDNNNKNMYACFFVNKCCDDVI